MLVNTTAAGLSPDPSTNAQTFFSATSTSNNSATFRVGVEPWYIQAFNLANGDAITVQIAAGTNSGQYFATYSPLGVPVKLTNANTKLCLDQPGMYRLVFSGTAVAAIFCNGFAATGSSENSIYGVSPANGGGSGSTSTGVTTGLAPIVVTGAGTVATPYVVSVAGQSGGTNPGTPPDGGDSTYIGSGAGLGATGTQNIFLGTQAGVNSTGSLSVVIGRQAGEVFAGTQDVFIGTSAGNAATLTGSVCVGYQAGTNATGNGIYLGSGSGNGNGFNNVIIIDERGSGIVPTAANYCMLGSASITHTVTAGSVIAAGAISASDSRLKRNVKPIEEALYLIGQLSPVTYNWDEARVKDSGVPGIPDSELVKDHMGLIAQEVEKVLPGYVENVAGGDGELYKFVRYERMVPMLLAAVKELTMRVNELEAKGA